jgi:hypothetical protein
MVTGILTACISVGCGDNRSFDQPDQPDEPDEPGPDGGQPDADPVDPPPPPALQFHDYVQAIDLTPDGRTALFGDGHTLEGRLWFVDTVTNVAENRTNVGDPLRTFATGISQSSTVSALHGEPVRAGVWTAAAGWTDLPSPHAEWCGEDIGGAWDISADGTVVVGTSWNGCAVEAFRSSGAGMTRLAVLGERTGGDEGTPDNRATVVSDDGSTVAGFAMTAIVDRAPAIWRADGTGELLSRVADDSPGEVLSINADGSVLAGLDGLDGVVWSGGTRTTIPRFDTKLPSDQVFPNAMNGAGTIVFGGQGSAFFGTPDAFIWSEASGLRKIADLAIAEGLEIPASIVLMNVMAASTDGTVLIGTAVNVDTYATTVFTLRLPASAIH